MAEKQTIRLVQMVMDVAETFTTQFGTSRGRSLQITGAACAGNLCIGIGKLMIGIISFSGFMCVSALYTFGMLLAKVCALAGILKGNDTQNQYRYYRLAGIVLIISSVLYIIYSIRLFIHPKQSMYSLYVGLAIAVFTFTELTINIRGVYIERRVHSPLIYAIKMINLASSLICLVLTQTALLSFSEGQIEIQPKVNGILGVIMGSAATVIGIVMMIKLREFQKISEV